MRLLTSLVFMGSLLVAHSAVALPVLYTPGSIQVSSPDQPGVTWWADTSVLDTASFTLNDGQSNAFAAFKIGADPYAMSDLTYSWMDVYADFTFVDPSTNFQLSGTAHGFWQWEAGGVFWEPTYVRLPEVTFQVNLSTASFRVGNQDEVFATVRQLSSRPLRPVPEPGALLSFLVGGALIAGAARRRDA